ncbi:MAG: hypothetical protein CM15mP89_4640 [Gammaproteobacteria bacterium]|nr:MAG: hypothetical protein CM15mP89_4640 [Gammaproteobacteria bacterium]
MAWLFYNSVQGPFMAEKTPNDSLCPTYQRRNLISELMMKLGQNEAHVSAACLAGGPAFSYWKTGPQTTVTIY